MKRRLAILTAAAVGFYGLGIAPADVAVQVHANHSNVGLVAISVVEAKMSPKTAQYEPPVALPSSPALPAVGASGIHA